MAKQGGIDRRRERRVEAKVPIRVRRVMEKAAAAAREAFASNVSLSGAFFVGAPGETFKADDIVYVSATIPESMRDQFPFTRLAGRGRVVRTIDIGGKKDQQGVALEFGEDLTVLSSI